MAWEWVAPVATGTVGAIGIGATLLSTQQARRASSVEAEAQRAHAQRQRLHDDKRTAYTAHLVVVAAAHSAFENLLRTYRQPDLVAPGMPTRDEAFQAFSKVADDLRMTRQAVRLLGPQAVRDAALRCSDRIFEEVNKVLRGNWQDAAFDHDATSSLLVSMKLDLGFELTPADLALISPHAVDVPGASSP